MPDTRCPTSTSRSSGTSRDRVARHFGPWHALPDRPTAVVVANVNAAIGLLREARELELRIPQDLSVVAIHDVWTAENTWPPLTTVRMPLYELGRESMAAIFDRIVDGTTSDRVIRDPKPLLVERDSTAAGVAIEPTYHRFLRSWIATFRLKIHEYI